MGSTTWILLFKSVWSNSILSLKLSSLTSFRIFYPSFLGLPLSVEILVTFKRSILPIAVSMELLCIMYMIKPLKTIFSHLIFHWCYPLLKPYIFIFYLILKCIITHPSKHSHFYEAHFWICCFYPPNTQSCRVLASFIAFVKFSFQFSGYSFIT